jgi:hypothetical protein
VLEAHVDFHLGAGVDVIFIDASDDDVPDGLARRADVHVVESASAAAEESGADWLIESEANEFWWPRGGSLKELLELVAPGYDAVQALSRQFVPISGTTEPFSERMVHRLVHGRPERRYVRRSGAEARVEAIRGWFPIEVLRFPVDGEPGSVYDEDGLRRGVETGVLSVDTRVRDALRALADGRSPDFARSSVADEARYAAELAALGEVDIARARERMDELDARLAAIETSFSEVVKRKLRGLRRRP